MAVWGTAASADINGLYDQDALQCKVHMCCIEEQYNVSGGIGGVCPLRYDMISKQIVVDDKISLICVLCVSFCISSIQRKTLRSWQSCGSLPGLQSRKRNMKFGAAIYEREACFL